VQNDVFPAQRSNLSELFCLPQKGGIQVFRKFLLTFFRHPSERLRDTKVVFIRLVGVLPGALGE
jgi:hypothetical protein